MQQLFQLKEAYATNNMQRIKDLEVGVLDMIENGQFAQQLFEVLCNAIGQSQVDELMFIVSLISLIMRRVSKYNDVNLAPFYTKLSQSQVNNVIFKKSAQLMAVYLEKNPKELNQIIRPPFNPFTWLILSEVLLSETIATTLSEWLYTNGGLKIIFQAFLSDSSNPVLQDIMENALVLYKDKIDLIDNMSKALLTHMQSNPSEAAIIHCIKLLHSIATTSIKPTILSSILLNPSIHTTLSQYCFLEETGEFYIQFLDVFRKAHTNSTPNANAIEGFYQIGMAFSNQSFPICLYALYIYEYCARYNVDIAPIMNSCVYFKPLIQQTHEEDKVYIQQAMAKVQSILHILGKDQPIKTLDLLIGNASQWGLEKSCYMLQSIIRAIPPSHELDSKLEQLLSMLTSEFSEEEYYTKVIIGLAKRLDQASIRLLEIILGHPTKKNAATITQTICMYHSKTLFQVYPQIAQSVMHHPTIPIAMKFSICCIPLLSHGDGQDLFTLLQGVPIPNFQPKSIAITPQMSFEDIYPGDELIHFLLLAEQFMRLKSVLLDPLKSSIVEIPHHIQQLYHSFLQYICTGLKDLHLIMKSNPCIGPSSIDLNQILRSHAHVDHPINIQINLLATQCYDLLGLALSWPLFYENENAINILTSFVFTEDVMGLHLKYWHLIITNMIMPCINHSKASQHKVLLSHILKPFYGYMSQLITREYEQLIQVKDNEMDEIVKNHYVSKLMRAYLSVVEQSMTMLCSSYGDQRLLLLSHAMALAQMPQESILQRYLSLLKSHVSVIFGDVRVNTPLLQRILHHLFSNPLLHTSGVIASILTVLYKYFIDTNDPHHFLQAMRLANISHVESFSKILSIEGGEKAIRKHIIKILE